ncbi:MAG: SpoIIE family protein phosphatase [Calditrichia bacterium]|nr:SpoIIE family protein phosphatase [Calditrichia bacterium]
MESMRLINIVKRNINKRLDEIGSKIIHRVKEFARGGVYEDDITLLMVRRKPE